MRIQLKVYSMATPRRMFLLGIPCLAFLAVSVAAIRPVVLARSLKNDLAQFGDSRVSEADLRRWALSYDPEAMCDQRGCNVELSNSLLSAIYLAPPTTLLAGVSISNGRVVATGITLVCVNRRNRWPRGASTTLVIAYEPPSYFRERLTEPYVGYSPSQNPPSVTYVVTPQFGARALDVAREVNVWCLVRLGGCLTGEQQAPEVWVLPETPPPGYGGKPGTDLWWPKPGVGAR